MTQGVRLINLKDEQYVSTVSIINKDENEETEETPIDGEVVEDMSGDTTEEDVEDVVEEETTEEVKEETE